ncbi:MAG: D-glycero-alpha-D-manno-heptose-1,7-bisphosphate 7-phosphatase [Acidobacteriaceae bacterium]
MSGLVGQHRALFLDRDGVVNREVGYLYKPEDTEFIPGIFNLCRAARLQNFKLIVVTNQSGIARHIYSEDQFHEFMAWMAAQFDQHGVAWDGYYYCPHHPEHGLGGYRVDCSDRKPRPGMLLRAARDMQLDLTRSILIGDRCSDIEAGAAAAVGKLVLMRGTETAPCVVGAPYVAIENLMQAVSLLTIKQC